MGQNLLIALPLRDWPIGYHDRVRALHDTWLGPQPDLGQGITVLQYDDKFAGLDSADPQIRQKRMVWLCRWAIEHGFDFLYRVDTDAYVWLDRLLASGFEQHDYVGHSLTFYEGKPRYARHRTANGGPGFTLSRRAMSVIANSTNHFPQGNPPIYWGDIWTGQILYDAGIRLHRSDRFKDGAGREDLRPSDLPADHDFISVHPVSPEGMREFHAKR